MKVLIAAGITGLVSSSAFAGFITPSNLRQSSDGVNNSFQNILIAKGSGSSVGSGTDFGDQRSQRLFTQCETSASVQLSILAQVAGYAPNHRLGWYNPNASTITPTWIVGGSNTGLGNTGTFVPTATFGLVLDNGVGNLFYSEANRNGGNDHLALVQNRAPGGSLLDCDLIAGFEDIQGLGDRDHNDIVFRVQGAEPVPEPATMGAMALGLLGLAKRRRSKPAK